MKSAAVLAVCSGVAFAQWIHVPDPKTPRLADGKANLAAPVPRGADGKPDLAGVWQTSNLRYLTSLDSDGINVPFRPWAKAAFRARQADNAKGDPDANCTLPGVPRVDSVPNPYKIIPTQGMVMILYEAFTTFRQIFTDGRGLPKDPNPSWMGYSIGTWDGDTFVVESTGFNDSTWLDNAGHPHSEALKVTERFLRRDFGHMEIQVTIDDPVAYFRPWSVTEQATLLPDTDVLEFVCNENNKDVPHLFGK